MIATAYAKTTLLDIAAVAARYGVSHRTLRFYETQGLIAPARHNGRRLYTSRDCVRLEIIIKGKKLGLSLRDIGALMQDANRAGADDESPLIERMSTHQIKDQIDVMQHQRRSIESSIEELEHELEKRLSLLQEDDDVSSG